MNIFSHDGKVTLKNNLTGNHRTFQVKTNQLNSEFAPGQRVLYLLNGPDNESDYKPFAFVGYKCFLWKKHKGTDFEKFCNIFNNIEKYQNIEVYFEARCRRCNRVLTTPESIENGIGPECMKYE